MKAVDTNILARFILWDDQHQADRAARVLLEPVWIGVTVWLELGWVLSKRLKMERGRIADSLDALLSIATVHVADRDGMRWAVERFRAGADWADMVHLIAMRDVATTFITFDRHLGDAAAESAPLGVETID